MDRSFWEVAAAIPCLAKESVNIRRKAVRHWPFGAGGVGEALPVRRSGKHRQCGHLRQRRLVCRRPPWSYGHRCPLTVAPLVLFQPLGQNFWNHPNMVPLNETAATLGAGPSGPGAEHHNWRDHLSQPAVVLGRSKSRSFRFHSGNAADPAHQGATVVAKGISGTPTLSSSDGCW